MTPTRIYLEPTSLGDRGQRYRVIHAGAVLIESSRNPEFDACRALLAKGITGQLEVWQQGAAFPAMRLDIVRGAGLTVEEGDTGGLRFVRWRPRTGEGPPDSISRGADSSRAASTEVLVS